MILLEIFLVKNVFIIIKTSPPPDTRFL